MENPDIADEIEKKIKEKLGIGPQVDKPVDAPINLTPVKPEPKGKGKAAAATPAAPIDF